MLPSGDVVHTGFGRFSGAKTAKLHRWGVGPYLDGLFAQSNLGIVTEMTMWLAPMPDYFQSCFFGVDDESRLEGLIDALQRLMLRGTFRAGLTVRNDFNVLSRMRQYPWEALDGSTPMPPGLLERMRKGFWRDAWWSSRWAGWAELHHASREQGLAERKIIEETLAERVERLAFIDESGVAFSRWENDSDREVAARYFDVGESASLGVPGDENIRSAYWRKKTPIPKEMDPDRDRCGVIFCVPTVPFEGRHVTAALGIIREVISKYSFEPILIVGCISERVLYINVDITYDREVEGEDERALECHDVLLARLIRAGYIPYRLGIEYVRLLPELEDGIGRLLHALKKSLDPNNILAPAGTVWERETLVERKRMPERGPDPGVVHVPPGGGRAVWFNGGLVTFYALGEDTGGAFTLFEEAIAPHTGAMPHLHHEEDQAFYVLEGNAGDEVQLEPALEDHLRLFGIAPELVAADRNVHSKERTNC